MEDHFVSEPKNFNYNNQNNVDFTKTFDLTGHDNDQMLKLYLKKAGYSDNIEGFTSEQRRTLIYDIVKSNKHPGYWKPSGVLEIPSTSSGITNSHSPSIDRGSSITLDSIDDIPPASMTFDLDSYRKIKESNKSSISSSNQEQTYSSVQRKTGSALYERQFSQPQKSTPKKPLTTANSFPTTKLKTRKGRIVEVSGPKNFRHVAGDMTRDMTKNTFDLSGSINNNILKKYMIERGITEEDVKYMERKDLIKRIVQSNYTWMPPRAQHMGNPIPPPPSERVVRAPSPTPSLNHKPSKEGPIKVSPPALPDYIQRSNSIRRAHPLAPPPPPPSVRTDSNKEISEHQNLTNARNNINVKPATNIAAEKPFDREPNKKIQTKQNDKPSVPPPPPMPTLTKNIAASTTPSMPLINQNNTSSSASPPPPPPPPPMQVQPVNSIKKPQRTNNIPPPPPPMPFKENDSTATKPWLTSKKQSEVVGDNQDRGALLESIRNGVSLKKVNKPNESTNDGTLKAKQSSPKHGKLDLMSELRNATLKRIQKIENNPYVSESEC